MGVCQEGKFHCRGGEDAEGKSCGDWGVRGTVVTGILAVYAGMVGGTPPQVLRRGLLRTTWRRRSLGGPRAGWGGRKGMGRAGFKPIVPTNCHFSYGKASEGQVESCRFRPDSSRSNTIVLADGPVNACIGAFRGRPLWSNMGKSATKHPISSGISWSRWVSNPPLRSPVEGESPSPQVPRGSGRHSRVDETLAGTSCQRRHPPHPSLLPPGEKVQETRRCPMVTDTNTPNLNSYGQSQIPHLNGGDALMARGGLV